MSDVNNFLIATIDSDIANVSDDAFGLIFAGGIFVMFGGVLSALIVGFILESRGSYANVIADSYAQGADDEDFWKGLSEEEKRKTQELLQKLKESKEGGDGSSSAPSPKTTVAAAESIADPSTTAAAASAESASSSEPTGSKSTDTKDAGMFSDYWAVKMNVLAQLFSPEYYTTAHQDTIPYHTIPYHTNLPDVHVKCHPKTDGTDEWINESP